MSKSKSKGKEITCFHYGRKGHKKPEWRLYIEELERKKKNKKDTLQKTHDMDNNKGKDREEANIAFGIVIRRFLTWRTYCVVDIKITNTTIINASLVVQDSVMPPFIVL